MDPMNRILDQVADLYGELVPDRPLYIHSGHFALFWKGAQVVDCFAAQGQVPLMAQFAEFSQRTFALGLALARRLRAQGIDARLCTLVNDWQYLESSRALLSLAQTERQRYYDGLERSPVADACPFPHDAPGAQVFLGGSSLNSLKSEAQLRQRFVERVLKLDKEQRLDSLGLSKSRTASGNPSFGVQAATICGGELSGEVCLVYGGNTNCAGEVIELLYEVQQLGAQCFVNFYPIDCQNHVEFGSKLFHQLEHVSAAVPRIVNVGLALSDADTRERFDVY